MVAIIIFSFYERKQFGNLGEKNIMVKVFWDIRGGGAVSHQSIDELCIQTKKLHSLHLAYRYW